MVIPLSITESVSWTKVVSSSPDAPHLGSKLNLSVNELQINILTFISRTLQELVEHYSKDSDGLCVNLCKPCVQVGRFHSCLQSVLSLAFVEQTFRLEFSFYLMRNLTECVIILISFSLNIHQMNQIWIHMKQKEKQLTNFFLFFFPVFLIRKSFKSFVDSNLKHHP